MEEEGDIISPQYMWAKSEVERLEHAVGDWTETIDYSKDDYVVLPLGICKAVMEKDIQKVLNWLGPPPVDKNRLNAKNPEAMGSTLMFPALSSNNSDFLSILLQFGAAVDTVNDTGETPLITLGVIPEHYSQARLLLEWGAKISNNASISKDDFIDYHRDHVSRQAMGPYSTNHHWTLHFSSQIDVHANTNVVNW